MLNKRNFKILRFAVNRDSYSIFWRKKSYPYKSFCERFNKTGDKTSERNVWYLKLINKANHAKSVFRKLSNCVNIVDITATNFQKCVNLAPNPWHFDIFFTSVQYCNNCMVFWYFIKQLYSKARTRFSIKPPRLSQDGLKWHDQFIFKEEA